MAIVPLPNNVTSVSRKVLNKYEQTLYNVLAEYFDWSQLPQNKFNILSQVRFVDAFNVTPVVVNTVWANQLSLDTLVTDLVGRPVCIFEADGPQHQTDARKIECDNVKDSLAAMAGVPVFRLLVAGELQHESVVRAMVSFADFSEDFEYPTTNGYVRYSDEYFPRPRPYRVIDAADIELILIKHQWSFPAGWCYATSV